jgi:nicotinate-nucleotide adenylyltransferase
VRIALFGGTFDPPHLGHLVAASDAHHRLRLDRLVFVPAAQPPHKQGRVRTPPELRLRMVQETIAGDDRFEVDDLELRRRGPSYTVDTLREFRRRYPGAELFFLLGADALREFATWHQPDEVARLASLVMLTRGGEAPTEGAGDGAQALPVPRLDISATEIRRRVAAAEPIRYLVVDAVRAIIEREKLYSNPYVD